MTAKRHRLDLDAEHHRLLLAASAQFGLSQSEVARRLIRTALHVGPALSRDNAATVAALSAEIRMVGCSLAQLVKMIQAGQAAGLEAARPVVEILHGRLSAIDGELTQMTLGHGAALRRAAMLGSEGPGTDELGSQERSK